MLTSTAISKKTDRTHQAKLAARRTKDRNRRFANATRMQQRVMVAKDVLKMLGTHKLLAARGTYFRPQVDAGNNVKGSDLRDFLSKPAVQCQVCAVGALFAGLIDKRGCVDNPFTNGPIDASFRTSRGAMMTDLLSYFTNTELDDMEQWFESESHYDTDYNDDEALRKIMTTIVKSAGRRVVP